MARFATFKTEAYPNPFGSGAPLPPPFFPNFQIMAANNNAVISSSQFFRSGKLSSINPNLHNSFLTTFEMGVLVVLCADWPVHVRPHRRPECVEVV